MLTIAQVLIARRDPPIGFENPSPEPVVFGKGNEPLRYVVLGDSTAAGQGADYEDGIAMRSARHLSRHYRVSLINFSVSGAKVADVVDEQLSKAVQARPDLVLLSVGANDVTSLTNPKNVKNDLGKIIDELIAGSCDVKIVITGAPDMGSIPRFAQPLRYLAGLSTKRLNNKILPLAREKNITIAPIAEETGPVFRQKPELFSEDKFHPDASGYEVWSKTINPALDEALVNQLSNCK
ncbi:hypothetical protein BH23PAT2_BH23PAT2_05750 [soil metagenome]